MSAKDYDLQESKRSRDFGYIGGSGGIVLFF